MKKLLLLLPLVLFFACNTDEEPLPDEVTVTFTYDQFVLQEDVEGFRTKERDWDHVFGGYGLLRFTEVNESYWVQFDFDGSHIDALEVVVPTGTYDISLTFYNPGTYEDYFPFIGTATGVELLANTTVELTVTTEYSLILVDSSPPVSSAPYFEERDASEHPIDGVMGIYYYKYIKEGTDGQIIFKYNNDAYVVKTDLIVQPAKVYKYKVIVETSSNIIMDFYSLFEELYFEIGG